jgi:hypothetical protein
MLLMCLGQRRREVTGSDPNSPKLYRRKGYPFSCTNEPGNIYSVFLNTRRVVLLLLRECRSAAGNGLGLMIKYL